MRTVQLFMWINLSFGEFRRRFHSTDPKFDTTLNRPQIRPIETAYDLSTAKGISSKVIRMLMWDSDWSQFAIEALNEHLHAHRARCEWYTPAHTLHSLCVYLAYLLGWILWIYSVKLQMGIEPTTSALEGPRATITPLKHVHSGSLSSNMIYFIGTI